MGEGAGALQVRAFAGVICASEEYRAPSREPLYEGQSAADELTADGDVLAARLVVGDRVFAQAAHPSVITRCSAVRAVAMGMLGVRM